MPKTTDKELADKVCAEVATRLTKSCTIVINVDANGEADYEYIDNSSLASADKIGGAL